MGVIVRLVLFLVGALGLVFTGLDTADAHFGVDSAGLLANLGETPGGVANSLLSLVHGGLEQLGGVLSNTQGGDADPEKPSLLASYGPEAIAAVFSALLLMFSTRR